VVVPLRAIVSKDDVVVAAPVVGVLDRVVLVEPYAGDGRVRDGFKIPVLGLNPGYRLLAQLVLLPLLVVGVELPLFLWIWSGLNAWSGYASESGHSRRIVSFSGRGCSWRDDRFLHVVGMHLLDMGGSAAFLACAVSDVLRFLRMLFGVGLVVLFLPDAQ
jgi:hypothetical protein